MMGLNVIPNLKPLKILAISSDSNFKKLEMPENIAGVFGMTVFGCSAVANVSGYTTNMKTSTFGRQVLFHEYNHFLIRFTENAQHYPKWYDEGIAEYWGTFKFDGEKIYVGDPGSIMFRAMDLFNNFGSIILDSQKLMNTTQYPSGPSKKETEIAMNRFYAQSFFLLHYLLSTDQLQSSLNNYLSYFNSGYTQDQAFFKAFNMTYAELDKNAKKYLNKKLMMQVITIKGGKITFPKTTVNVSKLNTAELYSQLAEILPNNHLIDNESTKKLLEDNIKLNPSEINAKSIYLARNYSSDPQKLMEQIEKESPNNSMLLAYKGLGTQQFADLLRAGGASWQEPMKQARGFFRKAIKNDRANNIAYDGLGKVYPYMPTSEPLQEGIVGLETSSLFTRSPQTFSDLADLYMRMDKSTAALPALYNSIAFNKNKDPWGYELIIENLEFLKTLLTISGDTAKDGLTYQNGTLYTGALANGKPHGLGKITRPNGSYYEGNFVEGVMQGHGKIVTANGFMYEGDFQKGIARGKGKINYPTDFWIKSYEGDVYYGAADGKGIRITPQGKYEGEFWFSYVHGKAKYTSADEKTQLSGNWFYDRYEWPEVNGTTFVGKISASGARDGKGVCKTPATSKIVWCTFKDGVLQEKADEKVEEESE